MIGKQSTLPTKEIRNQQAYDHILKIKKGEIGRSPNLIALDEWFKKEFGVSLIYLQLTSAGTDRTNRIWLDIYLTDADWQKMFSIMHAKDLSSSQNEDIEKRIAEAYKLVTKKSNSNRTTHAKRISVRPQNFTWIVRERAERKVSEPFFEKIRLENPEIVKIVQSPCTIFYALESQVERNKANGNNEKILDQYFVEIKKFDEFDYLTRENIHLRFDSKENLNKNYHGDLRHYFN